MKKKQIISFVLALITVMSAVLLTACGKTPSGDSNMNTDAQLQQSTETAQSGDIVILYTNDVHCGFTDNIGYAGLAAYKKSVEADGRYVFLVDCGDHTQGSFEGLVSAGAFPVSVMNLVGYDFAVLGNHEFDYGLSTLSENIALSEAQYLACNITYTGHGTNPIEKTKPYEIVTCGDKKVAFVGVSTPMTLFSTSMMKFKEGDETVIDFAYGGEDGSRFYEAVQDTVDSCKAEGADYVVVLSHCGTDEEDRPYTSLDLIANTTGIDAVLDAHSHSEIPCRTVADRDGKTVLLSQSGTKLANIGELVITSDGFISAGLVSGWEEKDRAVLDAIEEYSSQYTAKLSEKVAYLDAAMPISDGDGVRMIRSREMPIGDLVADAYRTAADADIGMCNGGGIRAGLPAGDVTMNDITAINPYGNALCSVKVTGDEIADMLEYFYSKTEAEYVRDGKAAGEHSSFMQVSGLKFTIDTSVPTSIAVNDDDMLVSVGDTRRVTDITVLEDGEYVPLEAEKTYTLASSDYMIKNGGSGMGVILSGHELVVDCAAADYQVLYDYITSLDGDFSAYAEADGRITVK